jgi:hypothetical protein
MDVFDFILLFFVLITGISLGIISDGLKKVTKTAEMNHKRLSRLEGTTTIERRND